MDKKYFSKITLHKDLNLHEIFGLGIANKIGSEYKIHQIVWDFFNIAAEAAKPRNFLYRFERDIKSSLPVFYVLSKEKPQELKHWEVQCKEYAPKILVGQEFSFSLRVNPRVSLTNKESGKREYCDAVMNAYTKCKNSAAFDKDHFSKQELIQKAGNEWLGQRAAKYGFSLINSLVVSYERRRLHKKKNENPISFSIIDFAGVLQVIDPDIFLKTLDNGVGAAKGFGCGLFLIKRV